jgi:hypothetical protein
MNQGSTMDGGESLRRTIENSSATDALIDAGDHALDHFTSLAGEVPILKWIVAAGKAVSSVRDYFLLKRIRAFLTDFSKVPAAERREVIERLDRSPEYRRRAAEALLVLLDRIDSDIKAVWVARALRSYAAGTIDATQLMRFNVAIERLPTCDADAIRESILDHTENQRLMWGQSGYALAALNAGLATFDAQWEEGLIRPTRECELFVRLVLVASGQ